MPSETSIISEIVERAKGDHCEAWRCSMNSHDISRECVDDVAHRVARAIVEKCAKIVEQTPFAPGTHTGGRQRYVKERAANAIRALAASAEEEKS